MNGVTGCGSGVWELVMMVKGDKVSFDHQLQITRNVRLTKALIVVYCNVPVTLVTLSTRLLTSPSFSENEKHLTKIIMVEPSD